MSFYDDASLVVIPSGYKTSKVYAEKPTDGSGDLAFTRTGDTATRVNSAGLIEKVRTNLFKYSEQFNQVSAWSLQGGATISANAGIAPDGTTTADLIYPSINGSVVAAIQSITSAASTEYAQSIYVKASGKNFVALYTLNGSTGTAMWVNLTTGEITNGVGVNVSGRFATNIGNGWWRIGFTDIGIGTTEYMHVYPTDAASSNSVTANGTNGILLWGAQMETGVATDYIPTTTAAVSVGPVANVPRLDYLGSSCPRLLLEPQRTNLVTYSEQFNNAAWSKNQSTISSNSATSPDGNMSADKLVEDSSNAFHDINQLPFSTTGGQTYTFSIFVKPDTRSKIRIGYGALVNFDAFGGDVFAIIDVSNKSVISSVLSPTILFSDFENGYVRVTFLKQATGSGQFNLIFGLVNNSNAASYLGDGSSGLFIWGAQVEGSNSSYPTSYIPTLAASATRGADAASKTGISSLIGQTEGVLFVNAVLTHSAGAANEYLAQVNASSNNRILIYRQNSTNKLGAILIIGGAVIYSVLTSGAITSTAKVAFAYKSGDFAFYVNGTQVGTSSATYTTPPSMGSFDLDSNGGAENGFYSYNQALLFTTRLTNAELADLTTI